MTTTFDLLQQFLVKFAPEVSGRSGTGVTEELKLKISAMIDGTLTENDRKSLAAELLINPDAMEYMATILKN